MLEVKLARAGVADEAFGDSSALVFNKRLDRCARILASSSRAVEVTAFSTPMHTGETDSARRKSFVLPSLDSNGCAAVEWADADTLACLSSDRSTITFVGLSLPPACRVQWQGTVAGAAVEAHLSKLTQPTALSELATATATAAAGSTAPVFGSRIVSAPKRRGVWVETGSMLLLLNVSSPEAGKGLATSEPHVQVLSRVAFVSSVAGRRAQQSGSTTSQRSTLARTSSMGPGLSPAASTTNLPSARDADVARWTGDEGAAVAVSTRSSATTLAVPETRGSGGSGGGPSTSTGSGGAPSPARLSRVASGGVNATWSVARGRAFLLLGNRLAVHETSGSASTCIQKISIPRGCTQVFPSTDATSAFVVGPDGRLRFYNIGSDAATDGSGGGAANGALMDDLDRAVGKFGAADLFGENVVQEGKASSQIGRNALASVPLAVRSALTPHKKAHVSWATAFAADDVEGGAGDVSRVVVVLFVGNHMECQLIDAASGQQLAVRVARLTDIVPVRLPRHTVRPTLAAMWATRSTFAMWVANSQGSIGRRIHAPLPAGGGGGLPESCSNAAAGEEAGSGTGTVTSGDGADSAGSSDVVNTSKLPGDAVPAPTLLDLIRAEVAVGRRGAAESLAELNGLERGIVVDTEISEAVTAGPTVLGRVLQAQLPRLRDEMAAAVAAADNNDQDDKDSSADTFATAADEAARIHAMGMLYGLIKTVRTRFEACARDGAAYTLLRENLRLCVAFTARLLALFPDPHDRVDTPLVGNDLRDVVDAACGRSKDSGRLRDECDPRTLERLRISLRAGVKVFQALLDAVPRAVNTGELPPFRTAVRDRMRVISISSAEAAAGAASFGASSMVSAMEPSPSHGNDTDTKDDRTEPTTDKTTREDALFVLAAESKVAQALRVLQAAGDADPMRALVAAVSRVAQARVTRNGELSRDIAAALVNVLRKDGSAQWISGLAARSASPRVQTALAGGFGATTGRLTELAARRATIAALFSVTMKHAARSGTPASLQTGLLNGDHFDARIRHAAAMLGELLTDSQLFVGGGFASIRRQRRRPTTSTEEEEGQEGDGRHVVEEKKVLSLEPDEEIAAAVVAHKQAPQKLPETGLAPPYLAVALPWIATAPTAVFDAFVWESIFTSAADGGAGVGPAVASARSVARLLSRTPAHGRVFSFVETGLNLAAPSSTSACALEATLLLRVWLVAAKAVAVQDRILQAREVEELVARAAHRLPSSLDATVLASAWRGGLSSAQIASLDALARAPQALKALRVWSFYNVPREQHSNTDDSSLGDALADLAPHVRARALHSASPADTAAASGTAASSEVASSSSNVLRDAVSIWGDAVKAFVESPTDNGGVWQEASCASALPGPSQTAAATASMLDISATFPTLVPALADSQQQEEQPSVPVNTAATLQLASASDVCDSAVATEFLDLARRSWRPRTDRFLRSWRALPPPMASSSSGARDSASPVPEAGLPRWLALLHACRPFAASASFDAMRAEVGEEDTTAVHLAAMDGASEIVASWLLSDRQRLRERHDNGDGRGQSMRFAQLVASWQRTLGSAIGFARCVGVPSDRVEAFKTQSEKLFLVATSPPPGDAAAGSSPIHGLWRRVMLGARNACGAVQLPNVDPGLITLAVPTGAAASESLRAMALVVAPSLPRELGPRPWLDLAAQLEVEGEAVLGAAHRSMATTVADPMAPAVSASRRIGGADSRRLLDAVLDSARSPATAQPASAASRSAAVVDGRHTLGAELGVGSVVQTLSRALALGNNPRTSAAAAAPPAAVLPGDEAFADSLAVVRAVTERLEQDCGAAACNVATVLDTACSVVRAHCRARAGVRAEQEAGSATSQRLTNLRSLADVLSVLRDVARCSDAATYQQAALTDSQLTRLASGSPSGQITFEPLAAHVVAFGLPWARNPKHSVRALAAAHRRFPALLAYATGSQAVCALVQPMHFVTDLPSNDAQVASRHALVRFAQLVQGLAARRAGPMALQRMHDDAVADIGDSHEALTMPTAALDAAATSVDAVVRMVCVDTPSIEPFLATHVASPAAAREDSPLHSSFAADAAALQPQPSSDRSPSGRMSRGRDSQSRSSPVAPRTAPLTAAEKSAWTSLAQQFRELVLDSPIYCIVAERPALIADFAAVVVDTSYVSLDAAADGYGAAAAACLTVLPAEDLDVGVTQAILRVAAAAQPSMPDPALPGGTADPETALRCIAIMAELGVDLQPEALPYILHQHAVRAVTHVVLVPGPHAQLLPTESLTNWPTTLPARPLLNVESPAELERACSSRQLRWFLASFAVPGVARMRSDSVAAMSASSAGANASFGARSGSPAPVVDAAAAAVARGVLSAADDGGLTLNRRLRESARRVANMPEAAFFLGRVVRLAAREAARNMPSSGGATATPGSTTQRGRHGAASEQQPPATADVLVRLLEVAENAQCHAEEDRTALWRDLERRTAEGFATGRYIDTVAATIARTMHAQRDRAAIDRLSSALQRIALFGEPDAGFSCAVAVGPAIAEYDASAGSAVAFAEQLVRPIAYRLWRGVAGENNKSAADIAKGIARALLDIADDVRLDAQLASTATSVDALTASATCGALLDAHAMGVTSGFDARVHTFATAQLQHLLESVDRSRGSFTLQQIASRALFRTAEVSQVVARFLALLAPDALQKMLETTNECLLIEATLPGTLSTGTRVGVIKYLEMVNDAHRQYHGGGSVAAASLDALSLNLRHHFANACGRKAEADATLSELLKMKGWKGGPLASEKDVCQRQARILERLEHQYLDALRGFLRDGAVEPSVACLRLTQLLALQIRHVQAFRSERPLVGRATGLSGNNANLSASTSASEDEITKLVAKCPNPGSAVSLASALGVHGSRHWADLLLRESVKGTNTGFATALRARTVSVNRQHIKALEEAAGQRSGTRDKHAAARAERLNEVRSILLHRLQQQDGNGPAAA